MTDDIQQIKQALDDVADKINRLVAEIEKPKMTINESDIKKYLSDIIGLLLPIKDHPIIVQKNYIEKTKELFKRAIIKYNERIKYIKSKSKEEPEEDNIKKLIDTYDPENYTLVKINADAKRLGIKRSLVFKGIAQKFGALINSAESNAKRKIYRVIERICSRIGEKLEFVNK